MKDTIKQYLRKPSSGKLTEKGEPVAGEPYGIMLASLIGGELKFGWSLCHEMDLARHAYDKNLGLMKASKRLEAFVPGSDIVVPAAMVDAMDNFVLWAKKYFRTDSNSRIVNGFERAVARRKHHSK